MRRKLASRKRKEKAQVAEAGPDEVCQKRSGRAMGLKGRGAYNAISAFFRCKPGSFPAPRAEITAAEIGRAFKPPWQKAQCVSNPSRLENDVFGWTRKCPLPTLKYPRCVSSTDPFSAVVPLENALLHRVVLNTGQSKMERRKDYVVRPHHMEKAKSFAFGGK